MKIPVSIDKRSEKRAAAIHKGWRRKTRRFLECKPTCFNCNEKLHHFSRTMLCHDCRVAKNKENHLSRNPGYLVRRYQENRERLLAWQRRYYLIYKDQICLRLRIRYHEKGRSE